MIMRKHILGDQGDSQGLASSSDHKVVALNLWLGLGHLCSWENEKERRYKTKIRIEVKSIAAAACAVVKRSHNKE
jgi:hypothetical protein